jgi:flavin reductase (DIM6/NTAB) family NADH-FMN oxidoreductase RutF
MALELLTCRSTPEKAGMSLDSRTFRDALGQFATGVAVVTVRTSAGDTLGLTINSFASVSLDPPLILWSIDRSSDRFQVFMEANHFAVNVLSDECLPLSQRLSRKGERHLHDEPHFIGKHDVPLLERALAHFECRVEARHEAGDHVIFIGRVLSFNHSPDRRPLVYYRGRYRSISEG